MLDNHLISGRQCRLALLTELLGPGLFLLTQLLVRRSGSNAFLSFVAGMVVILAVTLIYYSLSHDQYQSYGEQMQSAFPKLGIVFAIVSVLRYCIRASFLLFLFATLMDQFLIRDASFYYLVMPLLIISGYGALQGREKRLRGMELLFWFVVVPFIIALLICMKDIDVFQYEKTYMPSLQMQRNTGNIVGAFLPLCFYANVEFLLFLVPKIVDRNRGPKNAFAPVLGALLLQLALALVTVGVLGFQVSAHLSWPAVRVIQSSNILGGLMGRLDILVLAFWIFCVFGVISGCLFYSGELLRSNCFHLKERGFRWDILLSFIVVLLFTVKWRQMDQPYLSFCYFSLYFDVPVGLLLAIVIYLRNRSNQRKKGEEKDEMESFSEEFWNHMEAENEEEK